MVAVAFVGLDHAQRAVGDERVVAVGGEQFALLGSVRCQLLMVFDAAHDQPAVHVLALLPAGERGERHFGDLGIGDPALLGLLPDRLRVFDRSPRIVIDAGDRGLHACRHPGRDGEPGPVAQGGTDEAPLVVGRVCPRHDLAGHTAARAVLIELARSLPAPLAEEVFPFRNRARAITGGRSGVETVASWMFSPRTPE